ncbi:tumor necrosis factor receptor superfamily member 18 isoform X1 [Alexandromys fortis]|uniref:tumor necrosis factor receptor superfamily member 18 isoform X1 n=1 Tax=Alexandromys fortis TaxID=100897 RepID=UPI0021533307|nr:tumor necrosis factor receptor superfamily member 18 isoform X1 [Microtus fortis]
MAELGYNTKAKIPKGHLQGTMHGSVLEVIRAWLRSLAVALAASSVGLATTHGVAIGVLQETCPEGDCICVMPEYHCEDPQCKTCKHYPCQPGQKVQPHGNIKFGFKCVDCAMGTFSAGREGRCRPWADCTQFGFLTIFPGNKTHNAVCIPEPLPTERHGHLAVILLATTVCILFLIIVQLCLHIWQLRRQHMYPRETQPLLEVQFPPAEDACSFQFPEEERGEQTEEKNRLGDRWP